MPYGGGNPGPRLGQAQQLVGCKYSTKTMMYILTPRGFVTATVIQRFTVISDYVIYLLSSVMMLFD